MTSNESKLQGELNHNVRLPYNRRMMLEALLVLCRNNNNILKEVNRLDYAEVERLLDLITLEVADVWH